MGVNHLGHYLLTSLLYPLMTKTGTHSHPSRIVNVSSVAHRLTWTGQDVDNQNFGLPVWASGYTGILAFHRLYGQSKLAQIYHAKEVSKLAKEKGEHVIAVSLHPGAVATDVTRYFNLEFYQAVTSLTDLFYTPSTCHYASHPGKTPLEGAQTTLHCCLTDSEHLVPGGYYVDCTLQELPSWYCTRQQAKLREVSDRLLGIGRSKSLTGEEAPS